MDREITIILTTRGRYLTTLPLCLMSIYNQTLLPKRVILVDDNDKKEFQQLDIYKNILLLFKLKNIEFNYYYGESKGQVYAQQIAIDKVKTDWVFSMDDDNVLENNVLEVLSNTITDGVGAVSCIIISRKDVNREDFDCDGYNKIENIYSDLNIQMVKNQRKTIKEVEHFYSCYLFRKDIANKFALDFAPSGHRSETVFTYEIFLKGYKLLMNPNAIIWHLHDDKGGNRLHKDGKNELLFINKLKEWKIVPDKLELKTDGEMTYMIKDKQKYLVPWKNLY